MGSSPLDLGKIGDLIHHSPDRREQPKPVCPELRIVSINSYFVEKFINRLPQSRQRGHSFFKILGPERLSSLRTSAYKLLGQRPLLLLME